MFTIKLFGPTRVAVGLRNLRADDLPGVKPRQILELLALARGAAVPKQVLAGRLWDGSPPASWPVTLESYVSVLRRCLEPGIPGRHTVIRTTTGGYRLDLDRVDLDLEQFDQLADKVTVSQHGAALALAERALGIARDQLLEDEPFARWAVEARHAVQATRLQVALCGAEAALVVGEPGRSAVLARVATETDPLTEQGWQLLIEALGRAGRRADAVRAYHECRAVLSRELGLDPDPATQAVFQTALAGRSGAGFTWIGERGRTAHLRPTTS